MLVASTNHIFTCVDGFAAEGLPWIPIHKIPSPRHRWLVDSVNVVAIKIVESDRDYPISVFGTVLARDEYDYRCVYLFRRGRDEPQVITSKVLPNPFPFGYFLQL